MAGPRLLTNILDSGRDGDVALLAAGWNLTYKQLRTQVRNASAALCDGGLGRGERALIVLPQDASFVTALFATWGADGVVVPIDHRSPAEQIVRIARDCRATAIFCDGLVFSRLAERFCEMPSVCIAFVTGVPPDSHCVQTTVVSYEEAITFDGMAPQHSSARDQLAALMYTSGSTGQPKGVMHSHASLISSLIFTRDHLGLGRDDRVLISFPLYHLFAFRILLTHLMVGAVVIIAADIFAGLKGVAETRPNALILVPAACALLLERFAPVLAQCAPRLRRVCIGSAAISPALLEELQRLLPETQIYIPYGMTEARIGFLEAADGRTDRRLCATDPNLELRVLDENGGPVTKGVGEIVLRGAALMMGYWHNDDSENESIRRDGFHTRDLMEVTDDGYFLLGRLDDVISVGGEKVYPNEVETVLLAHPRIRDARVIGERDPRGLRGEVVSAAIVLDPSVDFDRDEILAYCRARLEPYKLPVILEPVPQIVRNEVGKVVATPHA